MLPQEQEIGVGDGSLLCEEEEEGFAVSCVSSDFDPG